MNAHDLHHLDVLIPLPSEAAKRLAAEIGALREAQEAITSNASATVIYGRIDHLIQERQTALYADYQAQCRALTRDEQASEATARG